MTNEKVCLSDRLMTLLGALWLGLFPLMQDFSYTRITRAKWLCMLALAAVTLLTAIGLVLTDRKKLRLHPVQGIALMYLGWLVLSGFFGSMADSVNSQGQLTVWMGAVRYEGLATQSCYILVFLLMSLFPARVRQIMNVTAVSVVAYGLIMALQYAGFNPFFLFPDGLNVHKVWEFQGTIGNVDMVSCWLCLVTPAMLFAFALDKAGLLCLLGGATGAFLLLLIQVQSGLIALAAVLAALVVLLLRRPDARRNGCLALGCVLATVSLRLLIGLPWFDETERIIFPHALALWKLVPLAVGVLLALLAVPLSRRPGKAVAWRWIALLIVLGVTVAAVGLMRLSFPEGSGLWELQEILHGRPQDDFGSERLGVWRMTLEISRQHPLFGTGPDTFYYALKQHLYETDQSLWQNFDTPHNMLLAVLCGSGVPALLLYVMLMVAVAGMCLRASRRDPLTLALLAGLAAYLLQGMFTFSICLTAPMFWAMLGMAVSQSCQREVSE